MFDDKNRPKFIEDVLKTYALFTEISFGQPEGAASLLAKELLVLTTAKVTLRLIGRTCLLHHFGKHFVLFLFICYFTHT